MMSVVSVSCARAALAAFALFGSACADVSPGPGEGSTPELNDAPDDARCDADTPNFSAGPDTGLLAVGKRMAAQARIVAAQPAQPERFENDWTVQLLDASGLPQNDFEIVDACAFMPVHAHGGAPKEVLETGPGTYTLSRLNLFMRGPWEIQLAVRSAASAAPATEATACDRNRARMGSDLLVFKACISDD